MAPRPTARSAVKPAARLPGSRRFQAASSARWASTQPCTTVGVRARASGRPSFAVLTRVAALPG